MRILVVDDHQIVRRGVMGLLEDQEGFDVCGEAVDGRDAIRKVQELAPDAVVMDVSMPNMNGLDAAREITRLYPKVRIVVLSQHDSPEMVRQALDAGAIAYVVKSAMSTDLVDALEKAHLAPDADVPSVFGSTRANIDLQEVMQRSAAFESALRESEERYRLTFEQAAVGIAHVSADGRWLRVNRKLSEIVGYTQHELRSITFQDVTYPPDLAADLAQVKKLTAGEIDHYSMEKRYIRKDGSLVWINLTATAVRSMDGDVKYFISVIEDINDRKLAELALGDLASLIELSSDAIVVRDPSDHIVRWNRGAQKMYGFTREQATGRVTHELLSTKFPEPLERIRKKLLAHGRWEGTLVHTAANGSKVTVSSRWCVARDPQGGVRAILETNRDISGELAPRQAHQPSLRRRRADPGAMLDAPARSGRSVKSSAAAPSSD